MKIRLRFIIAGVLAVIIALIETFLPDRTLTLIHYGLLNLLIVVLSSVGILVITGKSHWNNIRNGFETLIFDGEFLDEYEIKSAILTFKLLRKSILYSGIITTLIASIPSTLKDGSLQSYIQIPIIVTLLTVIAIIEPVIHSLKRMELVSEI